MVLREELSMKKQVELSIFHFEINTQLLDLIKIRNNEIIQRWNSINLLFVLCKVYALAEILFYIDKFYNKDKK